MGSDEKTVILGRIAFVVGITLVVLRGLELFTRMPGLPAFWYTNQSMWIATGLVSAAYGWHLLWGRPMSSRGEWKPQIPGRRFGSTTVYVREECHLCDDAMQLLQSYQQWLPQPNLIDIDGDPSLVQKFGTCIPVVAFDGKIRFRGRINELLLRRLIQGTPPL